MDKRMYAEYTKVERSIKGLDNELQLSREIISRAMHSAIQSFQQYSARAAINELERVVNDLHRYELRLGQRQALQEVLESMSAGELLIEGEEVDGTNADSGYYAGGNREYGEVYIYNSVDAHLATGRYDANANTWRFTASNSREIWLTLDAGDDRDNPEFASRVAIAAYEIADQIG